MTMQNPCTKTKLTKPEYYQLVGLLKLAKDQWDKLAIIEESIANLVGMPLNDIGDHGHVSDAIWSGNDGWREANDLIKRLKLQVEE